VKHYRSAEAFFADPEILLIVVATHVDTHAMFAEKAIHAGKHGEMDKRVRVTAPLLMYVCTLVIVDKPFARSSEEADRVIRLANQKGTIITCFQNRRWV
jgi:predicted dehydrogenase